MAYDFDISIVIPAYKSRDYITECLESVEAQKNAPRVECIVVDDHGCDGTNELTQEFMDAHSGSAISYKHIVLPCNKGVSIAKNNGILAATGEYLYFLDSDDTIYENCLESLWAETIKHPGVDLVSAGISASGWATLQSQDYDVTGAPAKLWIEGGREVNSMMLNKKKTSKIVTNMLVRHEILTANSILFAEGFIHEDDLFNFMLAKYAETYAIVPFDTYFYRYHGGSIMTSMATISYFPKLTDWMSARCGGEYQSNEVRHLFRLIYGKVSKKSTGLTVKDFSQSLKNLEAAATTRKERAGIRLLRLSPMPPFMRRIHGLRIPKKLVGKISNR